MDSDLPRVCKLFRASRANGTPLVLATVLRTEGSTYRKSGARTLMDPRGSSSGILSGGCLEADLREHAMRVLAHDRPARVLFDTRGPGDSIWGLDLGCEGLMDVWLQPVHPGNGYGPLPYFAECWDQEHDGMLATIVGGEALPQELGRHGCAGASHGDSLVLQLGRMQAEKPELRKLSLERRTVEILVTPIVLPTAILLCGAGPDAIPVAQLAASLEWRVTVFDHRPAYARAENFPGARVMLGRPEELGESLDICRFDAAVIMSHQFHSDVEYLRCLARSPPGYVGALGPVARRDRLLAEIGCDGTHVMRERLHGPAGLAIGANSPESIALSIVAQIHALRRRGVRPTDPMPIDL